MSDEYAQLAPIYETLGMADFAATLTPSLIDFAQSRDWVGRRAIDLGCGTGASVHWLANKGYNITGIDNSPSMLKTAKETISGSGISYQLLEGDIRKLNNLHDIDVAFAIDVLNELNNLRDLEATFASIARILMPGKMFIFDLHTIEGLAQRERENGIIHNDDDLAVVLTNRFDYDRQISVGDYLIFRRSASAWQRQQALRTLRGFPVQVVTALLQRAGFGIMALVNANLESVDPAALREPRVICFAQRAGTETE